MLRTVLVSWYEMRRAAPAHTLRRNAEHSGASTEHQRIWRSKYKLKYELFMELKLHVHLK